MPNVAYAWGRNVGGVLGTGDLTDYSSPVLMTGGYDFIAISNGLTHTHAVESSTGYAFSWGAGAYGILGNNSRTTTSSPVAVTGGRSYTIISAGDEFAIALEGSTGYVWGWGRCRYGEAGNGGATSYSVPQVALGSRSFIQIAAGQNQTLAIEGSTGNAYAWGHNFYGQLGTNNQTSYSSPVAVSGGRSYCRVSAAANFSVAIEASTGLAWAWGIGTGGRLGHGDVASYSSPVAVSGGRSYTEIDSGGTHTCAIEGSTGNIYAWGTNANGELGTNNITSYSSPVAVAGTRSYSQVNSGGSQSYAIEGSTGNIYAWGYNFYWALGTNNQTNYSSPVLIARVSSFVVVNGGYDGFGIESVPATGNVKKLGYVLWANVKKFGYVANANIKQIAGVKAN